jgi:hypothetical protein
MARLRPPRTPWSNMPPKSWLKCCSRLLPRAAPGQLPGHRGPHSRCLTSDDWSSSESTSSPCTRHAPPCHRSLIARPRSPHLIRHSLHSPRCLSPPSHTVLAPAPAARESCKATSEVPGLQAPQRAALWAVSGVGYHSRGRGGPPLVGLRVLHGQGGGKLPVLLYRTTPYRIANAFGACCALATRQ